MVRMVKLIIILVWLGVKGLRWIIKGDVEIYVFVLKIWIRFVELIEKLMVMNVRLNVKGLRFCLMGIVI